jgi:hypothetical protein
MQLDPACPGGPFPNELGMIVALVVEKEVDEQKHWIERLYRLDASKYLARWLCF